MGRKGRGHRRGRATDSASTEGREEGAQVRRRMSVTESKMDFTFVDFASRIACAYVANPAVHSPGPVDTLLTLEVTEEFEGQVGEVLRDEEAG